MLSDEQRAARDEIVDNVSTTRPVVLAGQAGTGKTSMLKPLVDSLPGLTQVCATTGKAAAVIRDKYPDLAVWIRPGGEFSRQIRSDVRTVHSAMYTPPATRAQYRQAERPEAMQIIKNEEISAQEGYDEWAETSLPEVFIPDEFTFRVWYNIKRPAKLDGVYYIPDPDGDRILVEGKMKSKRGMSMYKWTVSESSALHFVDNLVIDEASMLSAYMLDQLQREFPRLRIVLVGDPFQLPPVGDKGLGTFSKQNYIVTLSKIHRQAEDNPIIQYADKIRRGEYRRGRMNEPELVVGRFDDVATKDAFYGSDVVIVSKNADRVKMNGWFREEFDRKNPLPMPGDKLINLENNRWMGVFNGTLATATAPAEPADTRGYFNVEAELDDGRPFTFTNVPVEGLNTLKKRRLDFFDHGQYLLDYAYALTCHKAQGSEFDTVFVRDTGPMWGQSPQDYQRWMYTAVTRAREKVVIGW